MIGKTIAEVIDLEHSRALVFTDGSAVELVPTGYEADGVTLEDTTALDVQHALALEEDRRREGRAQAARQRARYEAGEMRGIELMLYETYVADYRKMREALNRQLFGG